MTQDPEKFNDKFINIVDIDEDLLERLMNTNNATLNFEKKINTCKIIDIDEHKLQMKDDSLIVDDAITGIFLLYLINIIIMSIYLELALIFVYYNINFIIIIIIIIIIL